MKAPTVRTSVLAEKLIEASLHASLLERPSLLDQNFDVSAAYRVLDAISTHRRAVGWHSVGYKIGFTNRSIWQRYGISHPIWAPVWSSTVPLAPDNRCTLSLAPFAQPRIEPEVVFKLGARLTVTEDPAEVLRSVEWVAQGFEIVQCHYEGWRFSAADCIADFGLHGALVIGTPVPLAVRSLDSWTVALANFEATIALGAEPRGHGRGALVLGSPVRALAHLARELSESDKPPPVAGDIITTGTLTDAHPVEAGQLWSATYSTLGTPSLSLQFI
jgi:2-keto-4-pentenoate hydratase